MKKGTVAWLQALPLAAVFALFFLVPLALFHFLAQLWQAWGVRPA